MPFDPNLIPCGRIIQKCVFSHICSFICQKLFFHNGAGGHFEFTPLEKNAGLFARDMWAIFF